MFTYMMYGLAVFALGASWVKDRQRSRQALRKSWRALNNMLPEFTAILVLVGLVVTLLTPETISRFLGDNSGFLGMIATAFVGAITLIPGFVAFPLAATLLDHGAGIMQIGVFVSTLMMVGVVTAPLEIKYFGKKETLMRNGLSFLLAFAVAYGLGVLV